MTEMLRHIAEKLRPLRPQGPLGLLWIVGALGLVGCYDEQDGDDDGRVTMEVMPCAPMYVDEQEPAATRSWTPPSPYVTFAETFGEDGLFRRQKDLVNKSIGVFFTQNDQSPLEGHFFYREPDESWRLNMDIENDNTYYLYGYIPLEDASGATIVPNGTYEDGAILTIEGLNAVTPSDVCVLIGAKNGTGKEVDGGLTAGQFVVDVKATSKDAPTGNFIFLLFDHLYSSLRFRFTVESGYAALRTIKLRKLELTSYADNHGTGIRAKYNATITLQKNDTGASPIVGSALFTPVSTSAYVSQVPLFEGDLALPTYDPSHLPAEFMGCFVPGDYFYFKLRSTYDVYDTKGNLIRQGCQAENALNLRDKFGSHLEITRGHSYTYNIVVQPTYLYVLSDPDLDNPTIVVKE